MRDGAWVGRNWLSLGAEQGVRAGMLERQREIKELETRSTDVQRELTTLQTQLAGAVERLHVLEQNRDDVGRELNESHRARALREKLGHQEAHLTQLAARRAQIKTELAEIAEQLRHDGAGLDEARALLRTAESGSVGHDDRRAQLQQARDALTRALDAARVSAHQTREELHRLEVEHQGAQTAFDATRASIERLEAQLSQLGARREELTGLIAAGAAPEDGLQARLNEFLGKRLEVEGRLAAARQDVTDLDSLLREQEQARAGARSAVPAKSAPRSKASAWCARSWWCGAIPTPNNCARLAAISMKS